MVSKNLKILVIDDDFIMRDACRETLERVGHDVELAEDGQQGLGLFMRWAYDVVLLDLRMPDMDGLTVLRHIREQDPEAVVIIISGHGSIATAVQAMKLGAFDYVAKPFTPDELRQAVDKAGEKRRLELENTYLRAELERRTAANHLIHRSRAMAQVMETALKVAPTDTTVLLTGESGTGKGLLARLLHEHSKRSDNPFVPVDCSTLVPTLFESELFGHVKGAFTGAQDDKIGKFELAGGGSLFFDEVGNISLQIQAKLLKTVEERSICKVGSNRVIRVDTRLIAATNQNLNNAVAQGSFRKDLFYRLNVVHIHMPPLRERPEDVPILAEHFLERFRYLAPTRVRGFTPRALEALTNYSWPGNVRELGNAVQRLVVLASKPLIDRDDLESAGTCRVERSQEAGLSLAEVERRHILGTLKRLGGRRGETARVLGIDRKTLRNKIIRYQLDSELNGPL
ncbi:MAG: sigma-54 dependent transcriptional regulator [Desulfarculaceae bacterium]|nr:sigma-54 dependent transcriptional regulator [Desulfarculaceae bacterium]MCF8070944.1 sigma-54 dependent transcriptional regulator [Desulfarculaceae bacterium]MCF8100532.1 sigma-54 dependent transcriptional regulator [Desulfarculaceae bacterium]MCF8116558.1 sigma-54 dependent transcriptional regulator [Desulfarculaceae bacterium]